ncbi:MAG: ATP-binding protein [Pseudomonadales bacterium]
MRDFFAVATRSNEELEAIVKNYRLIAFACGIALLAFGVVRTFTQPDGQDPIIERFILVVICLAFGTLTYFDSPIRRHPFTSMSLLTTAVILFNMHVANLTYFSVNSCFAILLVTFASSLILRTKPSLLLFQVNTVALTALFMLSAEYTVMSPTFFLAVLITVCVFTYISQSFRMKMEDNLRLAEVKATQAAEARSRFLANMSHEIRTPMNGVIGMTHLLEGTDLNETQRNYLETIRISGESLLGVINDILDFSKVDAGKIILDSHQFDLFACMKSAADIVRQSCYEKNLDLKFEIDSSVPQWVDGDANRVRQVVVNLLNNAIKFTSAGSVSLHAGGHMKGRRFMLECRISDTGIGIDQAAIPDLFKAFAQADTSTTREYGGTGLGLSIVHHLVELMQGELSVESEAGVGSTFTFRIPLLNPIQESTTLELAAISAEVQHTGPTISEHIRILLAEDNLINQKVASKMLERSGFTVELANNGAEALSALREQEYDLVLMDLQMPELSGLEVTEKIRSEGNTCPIIALTANAFEEDRAACFAVGMNAYISKPLRKGALDSAIEQVLKH